MGVVRQQVDELVTERSERRAAANARMIVQKEDELPERRELVRERLRELREPALETAAAIQKRRELLAKFRGVAPQGADEIREQNERILVPALQGQPCRAPARRAQEVGELGKDRGLSVPGGGVYEREPVALGSREPVE
jgi:hypothetical protein